METTNKALVQLSGALREAEAVRRDDMPTLNDFYKPSKEMKEYQALTMAALDWVADWLDIGYTSGIQVIF